MTHPSKRASSPLTFDDLAADLVWPKLFRAAALATRPARLGLANEQGFPHTGQVDFIDNRLNPQTGAIRLRASFDNAKGLFTPGLSAKLRMEDTTTCDAVKTGTSSSASCA